MSDTTIPMQQHPAEPAPESGRHPVNVGHLVMGVAFLGLTVVWALVASDTVEGSDIRWLMPIPWVAAGIAGVLATVIPARRNRAPEPDRLGHPDRDRRHRNRDHTDTTETSRGEPMTTQPPPTSA